MKIREKNPVAKELIEKLRHESKEKKIKLWGAVARGLNRPRRRRFEVNLYRIEKYAKPNETILVPGVVLSSGEIKKSVSVAALKFSEGARKKIEKSGGKCLSIEELMEKKPKGARIRIMG